MSDIDFKHVLPEGWQRAVGFSYAVEARGSRHLSIAGQIARHQGQGGVRGTLNFGQQWDIALGNVLALVQAAGGTAENITALRIYVTNMRSTTPSRRPARRRGASTWASISPPARWCRWPDWWT